MASPFLFSKSYARSPFVRGLILVLAIIGLMTLLTDVFQVNFGQTNYWDKRGFFFLMMVAIFPRLTLLFSSVPFGGLFWWLGFFFAPRILVACLATITYAQQNPILVLIAWFVALGGEGTEKVWIARPLRQARQRRQGSGKTGSSGGATARDIEVDYQVRD